MMGPKNVCIIMIMTVIMMWSTVVDEQVVVDYTRQVVLFRVKFQKVTNLVCGDENQKKTKK